jgi:3'-5' exoribonuclease
MFVSELSDGMEVNQVLLVREAERRPRRDGGEYLRLQLGDRTGAVSAMVWEELLDVEELARAGGRCS